MTGLKTALKTNEGKIHVFKQLRKQIIGLTDGVISGDIKGCDVNGIFGALSLRMDEISNILQKEQDDKLAK